MDCGLDLEQLRLFFHTIETRRWNPRGVYTNPTDTEVSWKRCEYAEGDFLGRDDFVVNAPGLVSGRVTLSWRQGGNESPVPVWMMYYFLEHGDEVARKEFSAAMHLLHQNQVGYGIYEVHVRAGAKTPDFFEQICRCYHEFETSGSFVKFHGQARFTREHNISPAARWEAHGRLFPAFRVVTP